MQMNDDAAKRLESALEALNARIARLAIGLGVALDDRASVEKLMQQPQVPPITQERRAPRPAGESRFAGPSGDRRVAHQREELRGLLVLRYHMETDSVNDNGLVVTRQIMDEAREHLIRRGFKPGADGLALDDFFNAP